MADRNLAERYIKKFKSDIERYLVSGVSVNFEVLSSADGGGVIKVIFNKKGKSGVEFRSGYESLGDAVASSGQQAIGGNVKGVTFKGTNKIMEGEYVYLIKSEEKEEWARGKASQDVLDIISGGKK